ncbi:MAG: acetate kinase [Kiritimatiellae bacterium]|nr:acetate kinase [Kiritimatiellia bacterium]
MEKIDTILVINSGSSSLKFTLYNIETETKLASGLVERIGSDNANMVYRKGDGAKQEQLVAAPDHSAALRLVTDALIDPEMGVLKSLEEVDAVGHRVLHGGEVFTKATIVTREVMAQLKKLVPLGPLHMPPNIGGIEACKELFPGLPNIAVFDTAFHQTMPKSACHYAISEEFYKKYGIRKYGFHGTSHHFVTLATAEYLGKKPEDLKIITCHLGNGSSIAAVKYGKVLDTTMGLTPLAGVVMGTRSGDIDPAVVFTLIREGMSVDEVDNLLNKKSGLLGVGGVNSNDMRDIINNAAKGVESAQLALDMWTHRLVFYVGAYYALLGGADAIVFTGGIGENSKEARATLIEQFAALGCEIDPELNATLRGPCTISKPGSKVTALIIPTDEELMIAKETKSVMSKFFY